MDDISAVKRPSNITFYSFNQQSLVKLHCHHQEEAATEKCCVYGQKRCNTHNHDYSNIWPQFSLLCYNTAQSIVVMHNVVTMSCAMMSYGWMLGFCECVQRWRVHNLMSLHHMTTATSSTLNLLPLQFQGLDNCPPLDIRMQTITHLDIIVRRMGPKILYKCNLWLLILILASNLSCSIPFSILSFHLF